MWKTYGSNIYILIKQVVALTGRNRTGPPCSVIHWQRYRRRQTTDASEPNNTGPLSGPAKTFQSHFLGIFPSEHLTAHNWATDYTVLCVVVVVYGRSEVAVRQSDVALPADSSSFTPLFALPLNARTRPPYIIRDVISIDILPSTFFHPISSLFVSSHVRPPVDLMDASLLAFPQYFAACLAALFCAD